MSLPVHASPLSTLLSCLSISNTELYRWQLSDIQSVRVGWLWCGETYQGKELTRNSSGNARPVVSARWARPEGRETGGRQRSPFEKRKRGRESLRRTFPRSPRMRRKSQHHYHHNQHHPQSRPEVTLCRVDKTLKSSNYSPLSCSDVMECLSVQKKKKKRRISPLLQSTLLTICSLLLHSCDRIVARCRSRTQRVSRFLEKSRKKQYWPSSTLSRCRGKCSRCAMIITILIQPGGQSPRSLHLFITKCMYTLQTVHKS